jgi:hypothetical protein
MTDVPHRPKRIAIVASHEAGGSGFYARYALHVEDQLRDTRSILARILKVFPHSMCSDAEAYALAEDMLGVDASEIELCEACGGFLAPDDAVQVWEDGVRTHIRACCGVEDAKNA